MGRESFRRPVRAICLAHPTTVNVPLAARCALPSLYPSSSTSSADDESWEGKGERTPLVLSVSLGADVITRMGLPQVREARRTIGRVDRLRRRRGKKEEEAEKGEGGLWRRWWEWRKLTGGERDGEGVEEEEPKRRRAELEERGWKWRGEVEGWNDDTVVGRIEADEAIPAGKAYHIDVLPVEVERRRRKELRRADGEEEEDDEDEPMYGLYEVRNPRAFYRLPLVDGAAVGDHMPKRYLDAMDSLP